jgi:hypothetical protein
MSKSDVPETARSTTPANTDFQLTLSLAIDGASDEEIADVTQDLKDWIREAGPDCEVASVTEPGKPGSKGLLEVLGNLGLKLFDASGVKALASCLGVFIKERRKELVVTVKAPDGRSCQIRAGGINHEELAMLTGLAQGFSAPAGSAPRT